ncbi:MAG: 4-hydroxy-tetrahydrodipicolinate synthase [Syntrophomonadaceae bacterium]|nr:4-hydroxy-tetrahydrodipicolinate synthase [Syntrophomonadaceae bacterium]
MPFPRLFTAMITPYKENLEVNYEAAARLAEHLSENGSDGIVVCGTTGEAPVLSMDEKLELFSVVQKKVGHKVEVWAGTGTNNTDLTIELSKKAQECGVKGLLLVTPYYNKPSQNGLYEHYKKIADSLSLPIMLYNVPGRTSCNLQPQTVKRLSAIENIAAVKEASGDMDQVSLLASLLPERIAIYSGDDSMTLPMLAIGAQGVVSVVSHLAGPDILKMMKCFFAGDVKEARNLHNKLFPLFKGLFITSNPIPVKEAMNMLGYEFGGFRLPLYPATEEEKSQIRKNLRDYGLLK